MFYEYVDKLRNREEREVTSVQSKLKQELYDLFEKYLTEGKITETTTYD